MQSPAKLVWMDGRLVPWADARVHVMASTLHYGVGVFEGVRCYAQPNGTPAIFRLEDHVDRLIDSARCVAMELPFDRAALVQACKEVVRANGFADCYLRPVALHDFGEPGLGAQNPVRVAIVAFQWGAYLGKEGLEHGIQTTISSWVRHHPGAAMMRAKISGQYVTSVLAKRLAKQNGFDEAIFCDAQGYVCEGTGENLFIVRKGVLKTPPTYAAILAGITRDSVLEIARELAKERALEVREEPFLRDELFLADEAFFTGTAAELTPIRSIDRRPVGAGTRGPITAELQARFFRAARGEDPRWRRWLAPVS
ncbi:MAG: branched-chain amino acid transaminase [Planctomycetes bacterium]|nr:branched-chain amino acid transaminase [Planctomycetota bacterium]